MIVPDILVGVGVTVLGTGTIGFLVVVVNVYKTPKRLNRLEALFPIIIRGVWAILKMHVDEHNGSTPTEVASAYEELTREVTDKSVSQKK